MLYLIGGAARCGKSILRRKLMCEHGMDGVSLDRIREMFGFAKPELGIGSKSTPDENAERLWPYFEPWISGWKDHWHDYVMEGDSLIPTKLAKFKEVPKVRSVFLGSAETTREQKFKSLRRHRSHDNWQEKLTDEELMELADRIIERSKKLKADCETHDIPYVDTGSEFDAALTRAIEILIKIPGNV